MQRAAISQKDSEIVALQAQLTELAVSVASQVQQAVTRREEELRHEILEYEQLAELRFERRGEEVMEAMRLREAELFEAWQRHEVALRAAWQAEMEEHWRAEEEKLQRMKTEIEEQARTVKESQQKGTVYLC